MFYHVELSQHEVDVGEDDGEPHDQVRHIRVDGGWGNLTKATHHVYLKVDINNLNELKV